MSIVQTGKKHARNAAARLDEGKRRDSVAFALSSRLLEHHESVRQGAQERTSAVMMIRHKATLAMALLAMAGVASTGPAMAGPDFISGATSSSGNPFGTGAATYPQGSPTPGGQYQQVYSRTTFGSAPVNITGITFFVSPDSDGGDASFTFTARLGTTARPLAPVGSSGNAAFAPSFATFTGSATTIFTGTISKTDVLADPTLTLNFAPFLFNSAGSDNLLLDINITNATSTTGTQVFQAGLDPTGSTNSIFLIFNNNTGGNDIRSGQSNPGGGNDDRAAFGLRTSFVTSPAAVVPEPSQTIALLVGGLGLLGLTVSKRRRNAAVSGR